MTMIVIVIVMEIVLSINAAINTIAAGYLEITDPTAETKAGYYSRATLSVAILILMEVRG